MRIRVFVLFIIASLAGPTRMVASKFLIAAQDNTNKWGFIDKDGKYVIQPLFEDVYSFHEHHALVKLKKKWGVIDTLGNFVIQPTYDDTQGIVNEGKITLRKGKLWGVVALSNTLVLPFNYQYLSIFNEGFIIACRPTSGKNSTQGLDVSVLDANGKIWLDYGSYRLPGIMSEKKWSLGKWPVVRDGWISLLYTHQFDLDILNKLDNSFDYVVAHHVMIGLPMLDPLLTLKKNEAITELPHFKYGLATNGRSIHREAMTLQTWAEGVTYYLDDLVEYQGVAYQSLKDENLGKIPSLEIAWRRNDQFTMSGGILALYRNDPRKTYIIDEPYNGDEWIRGRDYFNGDKVTYNNYVYETYEDHFSNYENDPEHNENLWSRLHPKLGADTVAMRQNLSCTATEIQGQNVHPFYNGYALVTTSTKVTVLGEGGWIYETGIDAAQFDLSHAVIAEGRVAVVDKSSGKRGYIDTSGKKVINFIYDSVAPFVGGVAIVSIDGKYGAIDMKGQWIIQPIFKSLQTDQTIGQEL